MIENEVKYVLSLDCLVPKLKAQHILQGYDKKGARVRKQNGKCTFNYKWRNGDMIEEFEMKISEEEFNRCFVNCVETLEKARYTTKDKQGNTWDIDFFYSGGNRYFAMAECELKDPHAENPSTILPFIKECCIYEVPHKDSSLFSSRKLSDVEYAKQMLKEIV